MTKNNPYDGLNYTPPKRTPLDDITDGYKELDKAVMSPAKTDLEMLQELHAKDPEALNATQRMIVGFAELDKKNEAESLARQKAAHELRNNGGGASE